MFGLRKRLTRAERHSVEYGPGSAAYSPEGTYDLDTLGFPSCVYQQDSPLAHTSNAPVVSVPRPPNPSTGGEPGRSNLIGYTTGLLPSRTYRQRLDGATLVVPSMGAHPATGPVGFSSRTDRLATGVNALVDQWLPSQQDINESFVGARNRNPLEAE